jgi:hypothetical protein
MKVSDQPCLSRHRLLALALSSVEEERETKPERGGKKEIDCR